MKIEEIDEWARRHYQENRPPPLTDEQIVNIRRLMGLTGSSRTKSAADPVPSPARGSQMRFRRKRDEGEQPPRRYATYGPGDAQEVPLPDGVGDIRIRVKVDIEAWARAHGTTVREAQSVLSERMGDASRPVLATLTRELGDMADCLDSATSTTN